MPIGSKFLPRCACGCGGELPRKRYYGRLRVLYGDFPRCLPGHWARKAESKATLTGRPDVIQQWLLDNQDRYVCQCGCGRPIKLQREYHSKGVPRYSHGHHPNSHRSTARTGQELDSNETRRKFRVSERVQILVRYDFKCACCGWGGKEVAHHLEFDHIVPIAQGGMTVVENGQPLCWSCHRSKTNSDTNVRQTHLSGRGFR